VGRKKKSDGVSPAQRAARRNNIVAFNAKDAKPALKHGTGSAAVKAGKLPEGNEQLQKLVDEMYQGWVSDLGGEENITSAKRALLWVSRGNLAVFAMGLQYIQKHGLVDTEGEVQSVAKVLATYGNSLRLNLATIGLERVARNVKTLEAKMQEIADREHGQGETGPGTG
jgi:hypothetical protein